MSEAGASRWEIKVCIFEQTGSPNASIKFAREVASILSLLALGIAEIGKYEEKAMIER
jgi:hypothetical protein